jgi:hypothetical protein
MHRRSVPAAILLAVVAAGCGHGALVPASPASVVPGAPAAAFAVDGGIRCSADVGQADELGEELPAVVVPVKVRIKNDSGTTIQVLQERFTLVGNSGRVYRPIPVLPIDAGDHGRAPAVRPIYASTKFFVAPRLHAVYRTLEPWSAPLQRDDALYERQRRRWGKHGPSLDVMRMALPEGVLDDGGIISGFLFFESPLTREDRVTFHADFGSGDGQSDVASIEIPFRVE